MYQLKAFFMWSSIINIALFLFSFLVIIFAREQVAKLAMKWYKINEEQFINLCLGLMGFYKICIIVFNVVPWIALCIVLKSGA
jgi:hypothetical protein